MTGTRESGLGNLSSPAMAGLPPPPYHYASYMLAAAMTSLASGEAFAAAAGIYAPVGTLLTGLAAYVLGKAIGNRVGGLIAASGVMLVPDASFQGIGNRWTSYFFFQQVGIGGAYGVAVLGLAWALAIRAVREASIRMGLLALAFCALSAIFKVQIFMVYSPVLVAFLCLFYPRLALRRRLLCSAVAAAGYTALVAVARSVPLAPTIAFSTSGAGMNLRLIANNFEANAAGIFAGYLGPHASYGALLIVGVPLILFTTYGLWLVPLACALVLSIRRQPDLMLASVPLLALAGHLVVALGMAENTGYGGPDEIIHKTFVWPYFIVCVWTGAMLGLELARRAQGIRRARFVVAGWSAVALGLALDWRCAQTLQSGMLWGKNLMDVHVPIGLYESARFIREHSPPHSVVQLSENDAFYMLAALGERQPYVLHSAVNSGAPGPEAIRRFEQVRSILEKTTSEAARAEAHSLGIEWLVVSHPPQARWERDDPDILAFEAHGYRVYRMD